MTRMAWLLLLVALSSGAVSRAQSGIPNSIYMVGAVLVQSPTDALLELPQLNSTIRIASLKRTATQVRVVVNAIQATIDLTVHYDQSVPALDSLVSVDLTDVSLATALETVLRGNAMDFTVLGPRDIFVYSATPENRLKFAWSVRTFQPAHADPALLAQTLNKQRTTTTAQGFRPIILVNRTPPTIRVRAVGEQMAVIAQFISDHDKDGIRRQD